MRGATASPTRPCWWARERVHARHEPGCRARSRLLLVASTAVGALVHRHAGQDAAEIAQRLAHGDPAVTEAELSNGTFVLAAALLHHRNGLADLAPGFEIAHENH